MKKKSKKMIWVISGLLAVLVLFLIIGKKAGWIGAEKPTQVEITKVATANLTQSVSASGKVQPEVEVKISPDVPGEIIALYVKEGDSVQKGQLLLRIQPENYISLVERSKAGVNQSKASAEQSKAAIARAESQLARMEAEFNRQKKLYEDKVVSLSDLQTAEANLLAARQDLASSRANYEAARFGINSSEAALKDASENLRKTNIYAPVSGIVSKLAVELGERVVGTSQMAGTELLRIANLNNMEVRVNVNENDIIRVDMGDTVIVDVDAYSDQNKKFKGIVTRVANTAIGSGGSLTATASNSTESVTEFEVRIKILPESYRDLVDHSLGKKYPFKPGMTATVDIITEKKNGVLTIPISAVTTRVQKTEQPEDNERFGAVTEDHTKVEKPKEIVFVNENGVAKKREVTTGITDITTGNIEITSGLKAGEQVITGPFIEVSKRLEDGKKVEDKNAQVKPAVKDKK
ncbi:efflux RND transporter periplasmic adaptor subunit [Leadbetterella sp. DM7]|uniref:efflux RND transporter periplasmic adaptor subunit n=1 Tax=Leadbetterella sp. DM7 TaxID=3235085 RepID=UPI00349E9DF2